MGDQQPAGDAADDAALLGAAVRRGLEALDQTLASHRAELARRAEQATLQAAETHPDAGPGRLLELLARLVHGAEILAAALHPGRLPPPPADTAVRLQR